MAVVKKTNPVGIDKIVDMCQDRLESENQLQGCVFYPRIYKNPSKSRSRGKVPEVGFDLFDYREALMDDLNKNPEVFLTAFFVQGDSIDFNSQSQMHSSDLSIVFQCSDLRKLFPSIAHRADEELLVNFQSMFVNWMPTIKMESTDREIENVYREFAKEKVRLDDMSERFVFRLNLKVTYKGYCCDEC